MKKYRFDIYVGCKSAEDRVTAADRRQIMEEIADFFQGAETGFSMNDQTGGYCHEDGEFVTEDSIRISLIGDYDPDRVRRFTETLKKYLNQESVLVSCKEIDVTYL